VGPSTSGNVPGTSLNSSHQSCIRYAPIEFPEKTIRERFPAAFSVAGYPSVILVRRDNIEHLVMVGGRNDLVIEPNIVRRPAPNPARRPGTPGSEDPVRTGEAGGKQCLSVSRPSIAPSSDPAPPAQSSAIVRNWCAFARIANVQPFASPPVEKRAPNEIPENDS
jgi:hypothetical protein